MRITASPLHLSSWNFTGTLPMSQGWALLTRVKRSKVKVTMHGVRLNGFMRITSSPLHQSSWNFTGTLPLSQGWALSASGQKVKGQGHNALITENGLCRIIAFPLHLSLWNLKQRLPMSPGCTLWMSESKCQRSSSQCSDYWKWFLAHNCFPFTSAIIKLHAQIPCESRICLTDIGVKNLGSLNWLPRRVFVPLGQPHSSFHWMPLVTWWKNWHCFFRLFRVLVV